VPSVVRGLHGHPFGLPRGAVPSAGRRTELPHVFIEVRKPRLDPCSQRFSRAPSRPHALPRLLQVDVSTSTTTDHSRHPRPLESGWGGCHRRVESCLSTGTTAGASQGQGPRTPYLGTPRRDCSRRRLRPDLDDSGHLLSRGPPFSLSGATGETGGTASAARACRAHGATGSCGAPPPRRGGTLTNPRGLSSTDCSQANRRIGRRAAEAGRRPTTAPFSPPGDMSEGRSLGLRKLGLATMESDCSPACRLAAAPLRTSAFE
jgi:hypothetical protein